jgi:Tfp pilus assembly protein PilO
MKRLPPAKRHQLIGVILATVALICLVYFVLIHPQNEKNDALAVNIKTETDRLAQYEKAIQQMNDTSNTLAAANLQLAHAEEDVAAGDLYAWTIDTMRRYKTGYRVEIPNVGPPGQPGDCELLGNFPYKQIRFSLTGTAYYHDLGKFIADFENKFTHCRVVNLTADPVSENPTGGEKLNFRMDVIALVKPNS